MQSEKDLQLQKIWKDVFKALGIGGLSDEDAAQQSLSKITFGARSPERIRNRDGDSGANVFKGKRAVSKGLENGQIFAALEKINDPQINKQVEDTRKWLDTQEPETSGNASTTVSVLLQRLFGKEVFNRFIDQDFPRADQAQAQVQPQPPKQQGTAGPDPSMDQNTPQPPLPSGPPMAGGAGQQPQMPGSAQPPAPTNPMPPRPAGAFMGIW